MQLLRNIVRGLPRVQTSKIQYYQQINRIHQLTPICSAQNFLQNKQQNRSNVIWNATSLVTFAPHLHKSIHTQNIQCLKYSPILNDKKKDEEFKIDVNASLEESQKLGLFQRFKKMAKDYWYVLIPVHVATSSIWLGAFYYTSKSGVDVIGILESYNFSETIIKPLRNSSLGHIAVAYLLYKIATPARYFVTVAGTTFTIKQGMKYGWIKPMPTKDQLQQLYKDKKDEMQQKVADKKQAIRDKYMKK